MYAFPLHISDVLFPEDVRVFAALKDRFHILVKDIPAFGEPGMYGE